MNAICSWSAKTLLRASLTTVLSLIATGLSFSPAAAQISLNEIVDHTIKRDQETKQTLKSMQYEEVLVTQQLDAQNKVTKYQETKMLVLPGLNPVVRVLSSRGDDLPTDPDEAQRQAEGKERQRQQMDISLGDLSKRFILTLAGLETVNGENAFVVQFQPKPDQPYKSQTERVLNHLKGRVWISSRDYTLLKTEANLAEPVQIAWIFATINQLDFHYELNPGSNRFGPSEVTTFVRVEAPFITMRQKMRVDLNRFEKRGTPAKL